MQIPTLSDFENARGLLGDKIIKTPFSKVRGSLFQDILGKESSVFFKLECWQYSGSFKPRGALLNILSLDSEQQKKGVVAVSAGNHAIAVSYAAKVLGVHAKVVMKKTVDPYRISRCKAFGADVILADDFAHSFEIGESIAKEESRFFVHPYEGWNVSLGTGTLGVEMINEIPDLDAVIVAIGGGGLISGISCAIKQIHPQCQVIGVEPVGADVIKKSLESGKPETLSATNTIADSLAALSSKPYSFSLIQRYVDEIVTVSDAELKSAMHFMFDRMKMALEPAAVAAVAAIRGVLRERLKGKRVAAVICGSNIGLDQYLKILNQE